MVHLESMAGLYGTRVSKREIHKRLRQKEGGKYLTTARKEPNGSNGGGKKNP